MKLVLDGGHFSGTLEPGTLVRKKKQKKTQNTELMGTQFPRTWYPYFGTLNRTASKGLLVMQVRHASQASCSAQRRNSYRNKPSRSQ